MVDNIITEEDIRNAIDALNKVRLSVNNSKIMIQTNDGDISYLSYRTGAMNITVGTIALLNNILNKL